ncbi:MAG: EpsG family protein [Clostridia bacterium]|nr:EpsG family protein [Clostridia bacterium]
MIWYLLNIAIMTLVWFWPVREYAQSGLLYTAEEQNRIRRKRFCIIATFNWIILSGCRARWVGADTQAYGFIFERTAMKSWNDILGDFIAKYWHGADIKDPGYPLLEKIFQIFSTNYQAFLMAIAVLFFVMMGIFIYKYSTQPYVSFVLFSCLFYSFFAITGHRQTIATAFVSFLGIEFIRKRKLIPFLVIVLLSSTVHKSVIGFIPFYFIYRIKINNLTLLFYWIGIIIAFIFRYQLLEFLQLLVGYESYQDYEGAGAGTFLYMLLLIGVLATVFYKPLIRYGGEMMQPSINALMVACFFSPLLLINPSLMRIVQYYSLFLLLLLPEFAVIFKTRFDQNIFHTACCIALIFLMTIQRPSYAFFFWG